MQKSLAHAGVVVIYALTVLSFGEHIAVAVINHARLLKSAAARNMGVVRLIDPRARVDDQFKREKSDSSYKSERKKQNQRISPHNSFHKVTSSDLTDSVYRLSE